jgi:hypothetical protein
MDALLQKSQTGLIPADDSTREWLTKLKLGATVRADVRQFRNPQFHKKLFALLQYSFEYWSEKAPAMQYKGEDVRPDFERFRKDVTILAGKYHSTVNLKGELRLEADSLSYASMDQSSFDTLYSQVIQVLLTRVFTSKDWSEEKLREVVDGIVEFA